MIDLAAGVIALVWPGPTALALVWVVAIWAFVAGFTEVVLAFRSGEKAGTRALFIVTGLVSIALGVVLAAQPDVGAVALAVLFGLYSLICGAMQIVLGLQLRKTGTTLRSALPAAA